MARRRFFVPQVRRGEAQLTGDDAEHLVRVLRAEVGQIYELSDNQNLYLARIATARKSLVTFQVLESLEAPATNFHIAVFPALFKFDRFEWMLEKITELGVDQVAPFEAVRTERGLLQAAAKRITRWQRVALESSQQSRRVRLPEIAAATRFEQVVEIASGLKLLLDEESAAQPLWSVLTNSPVAPARLALLTGPEGGWTDTERAHALDQGWTPVSLGPTILRAETATIAGLSIVQAWLLHQRGFHQR